MRTTSSDEEIIVEFDPELYWWTNVLRKAAPRIYLFSAFCFIAGVFVCSWKSVLEPSHHNAIIIVSVQPRKDSECVNRVLATNKPDEVVERCMCIQLCTNNQYIARVYIYIYTCLVCECYRITNEYMPPAIVWQNHGMVLILPWSPILAQYFRPYDYMQQCRGFWCGSCLAKSAICKTVAGHIHMLWMLCRVKSHEGWDLGDMTSDWVDTK